MKILIIRILIALLVAMSILSCRREIEAEEKLDDAGIVYEKKPLWQVASTSNIKDDPGGGILQSFVTDESVLSTYASVPTDHKPEIVLLSASTGQRKWIWNDVLREQDAIRISRNDVIRYQNRLFYNYGPRNYCIDLSTGQSIWRRNRDRTTMNGVTYGLGPIYFTRGTPNAVARIEGMQDRIYRGDIRTGDEVEVATPAYNKKKWKTNTNWRGFVGVIADAAPVLNGTDTLLIVTYSEPSVNRNEYEAYLGLYNQNKQEWVYDHKPLKADWKDGFNSSWLTIVDDKIFTILNRAVACSNWRTGELLWLNVLPGGAQIPTPIENKYLAVFSLDARLFLLDINTGETIWEKNREIMAVTNQMYYDQGVLYYLTKTLNAVEIPSGRKLWSILAPTTNRLDGDFWGFVVGRPGQNGQKGRIFTRTGYHTYCFEAIK